MFQFGGRQTGRVRGGKYVDGVRKGAGGLVGEDVVGAQEEALGVGRVVQAWGDAVLSSIAQVHRMQLWSCQEIMLHLRMQPSLACIRHKPGLLHTVRMRSADQGSAQEGCVKKPGRSNGAPAPKNVGSAVGGVTVLPSAVITAISCPPHARVSKQGGATLLCQAQKGSGLKTCQLKEHALHAIRTWLTTSTTKPLPAHRATSGADASIVACARSCGVTVSMSGTFALRMHVDCLNCVTVKHA